MDKKDWSSTERGGVGECSEEGGRGEEETEKDKLGMNG